MDEYNKVDQVLHFLCQSIAKINRTFADNKADDSHTNLHFDPLFERILGRWIHGKTGEIVLALDLNLMNYVWFDRTMTPIKSISAIGKTSTDVEFEFAEFIEGQNLSVEEFRNPLHFEIPVYGFEEVKIENLVQQVSDKWIYYRSLANLVCYNLLTAYQAEGEVRIWPHHFDTGIYFEISNGLGIGFGLARKDQIVNDPYFYLAGYSKNHRYDYNNMPDVSPGQWHVSEKWKGATLPLSLIQNFTMEDQLATIHRFSKKSAQWFIQNTMNK